MFFGNKNLEEKVALLEREIEDLKNQLLLKDQEKEDIKSNISKQLEDISSKDEITKLFMNFENNQKSIPQA